MHSTPLAAIDDFLVIEDLHRAPYRGLGAVSSAGPASNRNIESIPIAFWDASPKSGLYLT
jgi:hypothetical protein